MTGSACKGLEGNTKDSKVGVDLHKFAGCNGLGPMRRVRECSREFGGVAGIGRLDRAGMEDDLVRKVADSLRELELGMLMGATSTGVMGDGDREDSVLSYDGGKSSSGSKDKSRMKSVSDAAPDRVDASEGRALL